MLVSGHRLSKGLSKLTERSGFWAAVIDTESPLIDNNGAQAGGTACGLPAIINPGASSLPSRKRLISKLWTSVRFISTPLTSFPLASEQEVLILEACRLWIASGGSPAQTYSRKEENHRYKWERHQILIFHTTHRSPAASLYLVTKGQAREETWNKTTTGFSWWWDSGGIMAGLALADLPLVGHSLLPLPPFLVAQSDSTQCRRKTWSR